MPFQSAVALDQGFGVPGQIVNHTGGEKISPWVVTGGAAGAANIVMGRAFTYNTATGKYEPGGTGTDPGILCNPKSQALYGSSSGALAPSLVVPAESVGEIIYDGYVVVQLANTANKGDLVKFANATGILSSGAAGAGETQIANARVDRIGTTAAGLAVIRLNGQ